MNLDFRKILIIILGSLWLWLMITILYGCSASYHFGKFLKKGGTIDTTERIVNCPDVQIPATRYETRLKYRLKRDSIETVRYVTKWKTKQLKIEKKAETKQLKVNVWKWFFGGLAVGIWTALIIVYLTYKK